MNYKNIAKILKTILKKEIDFSIECFPFEETKGFYKNIYKIVTYEKTYILKKAKQDELAIYTSINNSLNAIPHFYGSYHFYGHDYILVECVNGHNAMKMDRPTLIRIIDTIIDAQKKYWKSNECFGSSIEQEIKRYQKRYDYLPDELKDVYAQFLDCFKNTEVTFSHEDLLPFNLLVGEKEVYFIDLEIGGILPYPTMLARLIAHTNDDQKSLFYLSKEDYDFAISYYFDNFIKEKKIDKNDYLNTMNLFIYNELIEWIYVYKKEGYKPNDFYNNYYHKALVKKEEILLKIHAKSL